MTMSKNRTVCKYLFAFLMILTVILRAAEETASHICDVGAECNYHTEASEDEHSIFLPYAYASRAATSINPDNYPYPTRNLIYSGGPTAQCIGDDVRWLQSVLVHLGYKLDVDGSYGPETRDTIKKFQKKYGLEVDGMSGPITRPKLREIWQKTGHTWNKGSVTKQATVTTEGTKLYKCKYCEATKTTSIPAIGNNQSSNTNKTIAVFTTEKSFAVQKNESMWLAFGYMENGSLEGEWRKMAVTVSDPTIIKLSEYEKTDYGYSLEVIGKKAGATLL